MAKITGKAGDAQANLGDSGSYEQLTELTKWSFDAMINKVEVATNKTAGVKVMVAGVKSASGSLDGVYDPTDPISANLYEGAEVTLRLYFLALHYISVPALIEKLHNETDIDGGGITPWSSDFGATSAWTYPTALGAMVANMRRKSGHVDPKTIKSTANVMQAESPHDIDQMLKVAREVASSINYNPALVREVDYIPEPFISRYRRK